MVEAIVTDKSYTIVCRPNKSLSWRQAKWFLGFIAGWNLCISLGFAVAGAWPILPFMGLEIACLAIALYYVQWKLSHQEVIRITALDVVLEYGLHWPKMKYQWPRDNVRFTFSVADETYLPPEISIQLREGQRRIRVGKNLSEQDLTKLVALLKDAQIQVRVSETVGRPF